MRGLPLQGNIFLDFNQEAPKTNGLVLDAIIFRIGPCAAENSEKGSQGLVRLVTSHLPPSLSARTATNPPYLPLFAQLIHNP